MTQEQCERVYGQLTALKTTFEELKADSENGFVEQGYHKLLLKHCELGRLLLELTPKEFIQEV